MPADETLSAVATALGRPAEQLVELDRRYLRLAFLQGDFVTVTVRDRCSREVLETTVDMADRATVDPAALQVRNRAAARPALTPAVRDLLLRHPDIGQIEVAVVRCRGEIERWSGNTAALVALADDPDVLRIELAADPEILDGNGT